MLHLKGLGESHINYSRLLMKLARSEQYCAPVFLIQGMNLIVVV